MAEKSLRTAQIWTAVGRGGSIAAFLVSTAVVTALLGSEDLGTFFVLQGVVSFASVIAAAGEGRSAVSVLTSGPPAAAWDLDRQWTPIRRRKLLAGAGTSFATLFALFTVLERVGSLALDGVDLLVALAVAEGLGLQIVVIEGLRARGKTIVANFHTGRTGGLVTLGLFSVLLGGLHVGGVRIDLTIALLALLVSVVTALGHLVWSYRFSPAEREVAFDLKPDALGHPTAVVSAQVMTSAFVNLDIFVAGLVLPAGPALALYGVTRRFAGVLVAPLQVLVLAATPWIARGLSSATTAEDEARLRSTAGLALLASAAGAGVALLVPASLLARIGIDDPEQFRIVFGVLAAGQLMIVWGGACAAVLLFSRHQKELARHTAGSLLVLGASMAVGSTLSDGPAGLAISVSLAVALRFSSLVYLTYRLTGLRTDARIAPPGQLLKHV